MESKKFNVTNLVRCINQGSASLTKNKIYPIDSIRIGTCKEEYLVVKNDNGNLCGYGSDKFIKPRKFFEVGEEVKCYCNKFYENTLTLNKSYFIKTYSDNHMISVIDNENKDFIFTCGVESNHFIKIDKIIKPPLGLCPKWIRQDDRFNEICEAINRFTEAKAIIPIEWITEYNELINCKSEWE